MNGFARLESDAVLQITLAKSATKLQQMVIGSKSGKYRTIWKTMDENEMPVLNPQPNETEFCFLDGFGIAAPVFSY